MEQLKSIYRLLWKFPPYKWLLNLKKYSFYWTTRFQYLQFWNTQRNKLLQWNLFYWNYLKRASMLLHCFGSTSRGFVLKILKHRGLSWFFVNLQHFVWFNMIPTFSFSWSEKSNMPRFHNNHMHLSAFYLSQFISCK